MTTNIEPKKTPDEVLAALIVAKLAKNGFIDQQKANEVEKKMAAGTATSGDWKLWIDLAQSKPQKDDSHGAN